jgi:hypothetical protein
MSRTLHANTIAAIGSENLEVFHLVTFEFSTPFRLTDHAHDISYDFGSGSETFLASGRLVSSGSVEETLDITNPTISLTLTGANQADISLALTENFNNVTVIIRRGFFDTSGDTTNSNIVLDPFIIFNGRVDSWAIKDDPLKGDSTVTWKIASHWADWEKVSGRKCTNQSAQAFFPNEEGFSHVYDQIGEKTWGRVRS